MQLASGRHKLWQSELLDKLDDGTSSSGDFGDNGSYCSYSMSK